MHEFAQHKRADQSKAESSRGVSFPFLNDRPETLVQRELQQSFDQNPRVQSQIQLQSMLNESPRVLSQAQHQAALSGQVSASQGVIQRVYYKQDLEKNIWREATATEVEDEQILDSKNRQRWILLLELHELSRHGFDELVSKILNDEPGLDLVFAHYESLNDDGKTDFRERVEQVETKSGGVAPISELRHLAAGKEEEAPDPEQPYEELPYEELLYEEEAYEGQAYEEWLYEEQPYPQIATSSGGSYEKEIKEEIVPIKEAIVSTEHIYKPLTTAATVETYNDKVEELKRLRKNLYEVPEEVSGEENQAVFNNAINLITDLRKQRAKKEGGDWARAIEVLNAAGAEYVKAMLLIQRTEPKQQIAEESVTDKAIAAIQDKALLQTMTTDGLLADPLINSRITEEKLFGWTNVKGEVGEFYGKQTLEEMGREKTKTTGGSREIINVVVTESGDKAENPKRVKEIDGLEVEIKGKRYVMKGIYEIKTTTQGKSNLKGELKTSLSQKWKALRDVKKKQHRVWVKEGEQLQEDITNRLDVPDLGEVGIQSVGPVRSDKARYDIAFDKNVDKITDQLACLWLERHPSKTIQNIQLGTGRGSAFAEFNS